MALVCCSCCLCLEVIPNGNHRAKKRLHGLGAAAKAKAILRELSPVPIESLDGLQDPNAVICSKCEKTLGEIARLEIKLAPLKREVGERIHALRVVATPNQRHEGPQNFVSASLPGCGASQFQGPSTPCTDRAVQCEDRDALVDNPTSSTGNTESQKELSPHVEVRE